MIWCIIFRGGGGLRDVACPFFFLEDNKFDSAWVVGDGLWMVGFVGKDHRTMFVFEKFGF